jgi:ribosomal protein S18 acetylase RimI-like enzyme
VSEDTSFVLKKGDDIAGMLLMISRENEECISIVAVHSSYRGIGLAKALLTTGIQKVGEQGVSTISIGVDAINAPAVNLYKKFGFVVNSRLSFFSWSRNDSLNI